MNNKYQELLEKKEQAKQKLAKALKNFKGIKHEDSVSELRDVQLKVRQAHLADIEEEIESFNKGR